MNDIIINYDSTSIISDELLKMVDDYTKILDQIQKEIQNIREKNIWNGKDSSLFGEGALKYLSSLNYVEEVLTFYVHFLKNANDAYQILEQDYSNRGIYE